VCLRVLAAFSVNGLKHFKNHVTSFFSFKEHVAHEFEPFESKPKAPLGQILHLAPPMAVCHFHVIFMWCPGESICQTHALGRVGTHVATLPRCHVARRGSSQSCHRRGRCRCRSPPGDPSCRRRWKFHDDR
jgi:hypothetical protein